ncbi:hypothetical protein LPJ64_005472, partial [Coemansia asiatica]
MDRYITKPLHFETLHLTIVQLQLHMFNQNSNIMPILDPVSDNDNDDEDDHEAGSLQEEYSCRFGYYGEDDSYDEEDDEHDDPNDAEFRSAFHDNNNNNNKSSSQHSCQSTQSKCHDINKIKNNADDGLPPLAPLALLALIDPCGKHDSCHSQHHHLSRKKKKKLTRASAADNALAIAGFDNHLSVLQPFSCAAGIGSGHDDFADEDPEINMEYKER